MLQCELLILPAPITARVRESVTKFMCGHGNDPDSPSCHTFVYLQFAKKNLKKIIVQGPQYIRAPTLSPKLLNVGLSAIACWKALLNAEL